MSKKMGFLDITHWPMSDYRCDPRLHCTDFALSDRLRMSTEIDSPESEHRSKQLHFV